MKEASQSREGQRAKEEKSNSSYTPAARQVNTIQNYFPFPKHRSACTNLLRFSIQINNFQAHPLNTLQKKYSKHGMEMHARRYDTSSADLFCCLFFLNKMQKKQQQKKRYERYTVST